MLQSANTALNATFLVGDEKYMHEQVQKSYKVKH